MGWGNACIVGKSMLAAKKKLQCVLVLNLAEHFLNIECPRVAMAINGSGVTSQ